MTAKMLMIFSDPSEVAESRLRLDREDRLMAKLAKKHSRMVSIERLHASQINDIYELVLDSDYDYIHFSGHGSETGIYLDQSGIGAGSEFVAIERLERLLSITGRPPILVVILACFSSESVPQLSKVAPFVISGIGSIGDEECIQFVSAFYERLFSGYSIAKAFEDAVSILTSRGIASGCLQLSRRQLIQRGESHFVESYPHPRCDSVLINVDLVIDKISVLGMDPEVVYELIAKKLSIHAWIFSVPRDRCIIPIGKLLFGEFNWRDASDVVYCTRLLRMAPGISNRHWQCWSRLLISYNDLASSEYRSLPDPGSPKSRTSLKKAITLLSHYLKIYVVASRQEIAELGCEDCLPNIEFMIAHTEMAEVQYELERYPQAVKSLEEALTNFHEIVDALQPTEAVDV